MMMKLTAIDSAITTETVALSGKSYSELRSSANNRLFVRCSDPANKGKSCVLELVQHGAATTTTTKLVTPLDSNVRSAVHEYGGGSYLPISLTKDATSSAARELILYTDYSLGHSLFASLADENETHSSILIETPEAARFADFNHDRKRCRVICIMEDHTDPFPDMVINRVVSVSLDPLRRAVWKTTDENSTSSLIVLAQGNDFYSTPVLSPNGTHVVYTTWNHPSMPWYTTSISVQKLDEQTGEPVGVLLTVPSSSSASSLLEPRWSTNDKIVYLSDESGWHNFYAWDIMAEGEQPTCLLKKDAEFTDAGQGWILGLSPYVLLPDGRILGRYSTAADGSILVIININDGSVEEVSRECLPPSPFHMSTFCCTEDIDNKDMYLYFLGGSPTDPIAIWKLGISATPKQPAVKVSSSVDHSQLDVASLLPFFSLPRNVVFPNKRGNNSFAYLYMPNNLSDSCKSNSSWKPPLLVKVHGGPTACASTVFQLKIQYWTSRGFAILDVDYGGSTGYGRDYRLSLNGQWGITDVDDVCSGAEWCAEQGFVDANSICIDGGSAGGYTTLASLAFRDTFKVGASLYGVADLSALAEETHKFESKYLDTLVGRYPEEKHIYDERAPINFTDQLNCPVILLHCHDK